MRNFASTALSCLAIFVLAACGDDDRPPPGDGGRMDGPIMIDGGMRTDAPMTDGGGGVDAPMTDGGGMDAPMMDGAMDGGGVDGGSDAGTDGGVACVAMDLGSATGLAVATGSTAAEADDFRGSCTTGMGSADIAFRWEAPSAGTYVFDTNDSAYDTVLYLLAGNCGGAEVACDDDGGPGTRSRFARDFTAGEVVIIVVDGWMASSSGDFSLAITTTAVETACMDTMDEDRDGDVDCDDSDCDALDSCHESGATECADTLDNDGDGDTDCADFECDTLAVCVETMCANTTDDDGDGDADCADSDCFTDAACGTCPGVDIAMMTGTAVVSGTTGGGTNRRSGSCGGSSSNDSTIEFTAPATGEYTFTTVGSSFDTVLYVLGAGCLGPELACDDDIGGGVVTSSVAVPLAMGQTVIVVIDGFLGEEGPWELNITSTAMTYAAPAAGEVVITEIMYDPAGGGTEVEWIEVYNTSTAPLDLTGCTITDAVPTMGTLGSLVVSANDTVVLARLAAGNGFTPSAVYGTVGLNNDGDSVILTCGATEVDRVEYGTTFPDPTERSLSLDPDSRTSAANDVGTNWCASAFFDGSYDRANYGTPGVTNSDCP